MTAKLRMGGQPTKTPLHTYISVIYVTITNTCRLFRCRNIKLDYKSHFVNDNTGPTRRLEHFRDRFILHYNRYDFLRQS